MELIAYMSGYANFDGIVDPNNGDVLVKLETGRYGTDDGIELKIINDRVITIDRAYTVTACDLRSGALIRSGLFRSEAPWLLALFPGETYLDPSLSLAILPSGLVAGAVHTQNSGGLMPDGVGTYLVLYDPVNGTGILSGLMFTNGPFKKAFAFGNGVVFFESSSAFFVTLDVNGIIDTVTSITIPDGNDTYNAFDGRYVLCRTFSGRALIDLQTQSVVWDTVNDIVVGGITRYMDNPGRASTSFNGRMWVRGMDGVVLGVSLTTVDDVVAIQMQYPTLPGLASSAIVSMMEVAALSDGGFVCGWGGAVTVHDAAGAFVRLLPCNDIGPKREDARAIHVVNLNTYSVSGTTSPANLDVRCYDQDYDREIGRTVSTGGTFEFRVLGSSPVTVACNPPNGSENAKISRNIPVTLEV